MPTGIKKKMYVKMANTYKKHYKIHHVPLWTIFLKEVSSEQHYILT